MQCGICGHVIEFRVDLILLESNACIYDMIAVTN